MELDKILCDSVNRIAIPSVLIDPYNWMKNDPIPIMGFFFSINGKFKMLGDGNGGMSTIPGFNQIQFEGFCRFIDQGLAEELYKFPKIKDTNQEIKGGSGIRERGQ